MMIRLAWAVVALVIALSVVAALFRVATAPERIAERRHTAKAVCVRSGGEWVRDGRDEGCKLASR